MSTKRVFGAVGAFAALAVVAAGCGSDSSSGGSSSSAPSSKSMGSSSSAMTSSPAMSSGSAMSGAMGDTFGSACSAVPKTGKGSFNGMATAPVATAASNNPVLSTLVKAVGAAGLGDTLNNQKALTVFAPYDGAFAKIPAATLKSVLANKALLTKILTYHVIAGRLSPDQLAGTHKTLEGGTVKVTKSGANYNVGPNGTEANVICGNVQTANATVYIIDSVMMPAS